MADNIEQEHSGNHHEKKFWGRMLEENFQWILLVLSIVLGLRKPPEAGETGPGGKEIPGWILRIFSSLTKEDETEYNLILDSYPDPAILAVESAFRNNFIREGYDETDYRLSLVDLRREYLERLRNPAPEDKSGGRLSFTPITLRDSATKFLDQLLYETRVGTPEEVFARQKKIALDRKILKKTGALKRAFHWHESHKLETIVGLFLFPIAAVMFLLWLLGGIRIF
jgi:hypothetical protein